MATIKYSELFDAEVNAFRASGQNVSKSIEAVPVLPGISLDTVNEYGMRLSDIKAVMVLFAALIKKDAQDMDKLVLTLTKADAE